MTKPFKIALVLATVLAGPCIAQKLLTESVNGRESVANEVLVKYRDGAAGQRDRIKLSVNAEVEEEVGSGRVFRIKSKTKNASELMQQLAADPDVELVEPNYIVYASAAPNDTEFSLLWGLQNTGQTIGGQVGYANSDIQAVKAWDLTTGSASVAVGIVDTGVAYNHADLAANVWSAPSSFSVAIGGTTITCAAGTHGFNAITKTCDPLDDHNHGTHVAGTIGALGNNSMGVTGINWTTSIIGLKFLDSSGSGSTADAINAIDFAGQLKSRGIANVRVLNNSWGGGGFSQLLLDAVNRANSNDILFVAAAGNSAANNDVVPSYPANYTAANVVSVAATDNRDARASFSNYGANTVHLAAPGVNIRSTVRSGYGYMSGTSMAAPHVTGAAALALSACGSLNTAALKSALLDTVDPVASMTGKAITGGRLNVYRAITQCAGPPSPSFSLAASPSSLSLTAGSSTSSTLTVAALNGFTGDVGFTTSALPTGVTASFGANPIVNSGTPLLTLSTTAATPAGTYTVTVTASSGSLTKTAAITLTVNAAVPPSFSLAVSPTSNTVPSGSSTAATVTVAALSGFSGTVDLSTSTLPTGVTATFVPPSITSSGTSALTLATAATTPPGTYSITIRGVSGSLTKSAAFSLVVPTPTFNMTLSPTSKTVVMGTSATTTVTVSSLYGFTSTVDLSTSSLPTGVTAIFAPASVTTSGTSTLTLTTSTSTPPGTYPITIRGISGSLTKTASFSLVIPTPAFNMTLSPTSKTVVMGTSATTTITVALLNGFSSTVGLSTSTLPAGITATFTPASVTTSGTSTLTLTTSTSTPPGTHSITIRGISGSLTKTATFSLTIPTPAFNMTLSPTAKTVVMGTSATTTVTVSPLNGFTSTVDLSTSTLPTGVTATFAPASVTTSGTSTLTLATSIAIPPGTYSITIRGVSGSLTKAATFSLVIPTPAFNMTLAPTSKTVVMGTSTTATVTVSALNGFTSTVALSTSSLPTGVTATFVPASITASGTSTLTLATSTITLPGTYRITISGVSGGLTKIAVFSLVIPTPALNMALYPASKTVAAGTSAVSSIQVSPLYGFSGTVTFSTSSLPAGVTASFAPASISTSGSSSLRLATASTTPGGTYSITIQGTSGALTKTAVFSLTVTP